MTILTCNTGRDVRAMLFAWVGPQRGRRLAHTIERAFYAPRQKTKNTNKKTNKKKKVLCFWSCHYAFYFPELAYNYNS